MKEKFIKVIVVTKDKIQVKRIENNLKSLQEIVEGYIECFDIKDNHTIICNEEGKIMNLEPNLYVIHKGIIIEILCGNLIICNVDKNGEFASLTDEEIEILKNNYDFMLCREVEI